MKFSAIRVDYHRAYAAAVFADFAGSFNPKVVEAAYGLGFPRPLLSGDRLYTYHSHGIIGWGRITPHPEENAVFIGLGVWPARARQGWRKDIRAHLASVAFQECNEFPVRQVIIGVLTTNIEHLARCQHEAVDGGPWRSSGVVWYPPPGHYLFTLTKGDFGRIVEGL